MHFKAYSWFILPIQYCKSECGNVQRNKTSRMEENWNISSQIEYWNCWCRYIHYVFTYRNSSVNIGLSWSNKGNTLNIFSLSNYLTVDVALDDTVARREGNVNWVILFTSWTDMIDKTTHTAGSWMVRSTRQHNKLDGQYEKTTHLHADNLMVSSTDRHTQLVVRCSGRHDDTKTREWSCRYHVYSCSNKWSF